MTCDFDDTFESLDTDGWHVAHHDFDHPHFATDWRRSQVYAQGGLDLHLTPSGAKRWHGGALRRHRAASFGTFGAQVRAAPGAGVVTGVFLYSGPAYGTPHVEVDMEFLGHRPNEVHLALHCDGKRWERRVKLPFTATEYAAFYAIERCPGHVIWKVNDNPICTMIEADFPLPNIALYPFLNVWVAAPSISDWAGRPAPSWSATARIDRAFFRGR
ncbi:MAG: family 16 glycosylhydrolase [Shimia sp.]